MQKNPPFPFVVGHIKSKQRDHVALLIDDLSIRPFSRSLVHGQEQVGSWGDHSATVEPIHSCATQAKIRHTTHQQSMAWEAHHKHSIQRFPLALEGKKEDLVEWRKDF